MLATAEKTSLLMRIKMCDRVERVGWAKVDSVFEFQEAMGAHGCDKATVDHPVLKENRRSR